MVRVRLVPNLFSGLMSVLHDFVGLPRNRANDTVGSGDVRGRRSDGGW